MTLTVADPALAAGDAGRVTGDQERPDPEVPERARRRTFTAAHRLRAGSSAQVMAALRNTAIAVLHLAGFTSTAQGRRWAARDAARPVAALDLTI